MDSSRRFGFLFVVLAALALAGCGGGGGGASAYFKLHRHHPGIGRCGERRNCQPDSDRHLFERRYRRHHDEGCMGLG